MGERGALRDYIQSLRKTGYDDSAISQYLLSQGYSAEQVRSAMSRHSISVVPFILGFAAILAAAGVVIYLLAFSGAQQVTVKITTGQFEVEPGASLKFIYTILPNELASNPQARVIGPDGKTVPMHVSMSGRDGTLTVPGDAQNGRYTLVIEAGSGKASGVQSLHFMVNSQEKPVATVPEPQAETPAATFAPPESLCTLGCDDYNPCTEDTCDEGVCVYAAKSKPCCGDQECSQGETSVTCELDCGEKTALPSTQELITLAQETYSADRGKALGLCGALPKLLDRDACFNEVARFHVQPSVCSSISDESKKDNCLLFFAVKHQRFDVCDDIFGALDQSICFSLKNLNEAKVAAETTSTPAP